MIARVRRPLPALPPVDPALAAAAAVLGAVVLFDPDQLAPALAFALQALLDVAPYLAASIAIAAWTTASGADSLVAAAFRGRGAVTVVAAALVGAVSPFCSCGVIPLIAALLAMGVPLAPVMAFWLASPIMDPSMFALTAGTLGLDFAVAKTVAAFAIGLTGGAGTLALARTGRLADPLRRGSAGAGCAQARLAAGQPVAWSFWNEPARRRGFVRAFADNTLFLGKWLALAFLLESLMLAYVPAQAVAGLVGGGGALTVLGATLVGIPAYLNGYAALPLVQGLISQGMAPGAAMAFLVAGGVTSIPAAVAVFALARRPVFLAYLGFALGGAFMAGLLFQLVRVGVPW